MVSGEEHGSGPTQQPGIIEEAVESLKPAADMEAYIGAKLKALYSEIVSQPVPDSLLDILKRLDGDESRR